MPARKRRGDYPTPPWLVDARRRRGRHRAVARRATWWCVDPACGDGRFLVAAARRVARARRAARAGRRRHRRRRGVPRPRPPRWRRATARVELRRRARPRLGLAGARRRRRRQPAVPVAARRRRRRAAAPAATAAARTPTPPSSSSPSPARLRAARRRAASGSCCRSRSWRRATPPPVRAEVDRRAGDHVVVVVAGRRLRRPGPRVRAGRSRLGAPHGDRRRAWTDVVTGALGVPALPDARDRRHARRPRPADGQLPRPVLRAGAGRRRRRRRARRSSRAGSIDPATCAVGRAAGHVRPPALPPPDRRARPAEPGDAALGRRPARAEGARRQPDAGDRGRRRRRRRVAAGRPADHAPARRRAPTPWAIAAVLTSPVASGVGLAPRRRHRAVAPASCGSGRAGWPTCRGRPATLEPAVDGAARPATSTPAAAPSTACVRRRPGADGRRAGVVGGRTARRRSEFPQHRHAPRDGARRRPLPDSGPWIGAGRPAIAGARAVPLLAVAAACGDDSPSAGGPGRRRGVSEGEQLAQRPRVHGVPRRRRAGRHRARRGPASSARRSTLDDGSTVDGRRGVPHAVDQRSGGPGRRRLLACAMPENAADRRRGRRPRRLHRRAQRRVVR